MAVSISIESAELLEQFQWKNAKECETHLQENREAVADEMADVAIYLFELADLLEMDLGQEMLRKLDKNAAKYPVEKARGVTSNTTGWIDKTAWYQRADSVCSRGCASRPEHLAKAAEGHGADGGVERVGSGRSR